MNSEEDRAMIVAPGIDLGKRKIVVAQDQAELEFENFLEAMDIELDTARMDIEDFEAYTKNKKRILKATMLGSLTYNDNGEPVFTSSKGDILTFHERTGASLMAADGKKETHRAAMMYAMLGDICKCHPNTFAKMPGRDLKIVEALFGFLMQ